MSKQAIRERAAQDYHRYLQRRHNVLQRTIQGRKMKPLVAAIRQMFARGLPHGWGEA
jgi:hypothetical protein